MFRRIFKNFVRNNKSNVLAILIMKYVVWNNRRILSVVLRYDPIVRFISHMDNYKDMRIIEIGSNCQGIGYYLRMKITGIDLSCNQEDIMSYGKYLDFHQCDATALNFDDNSFDIAISVDMLEHLNQEQRKNAIKEMIRVSKKWVILALPFSGQTETYEERLNQLFKKRYGKGNPALEEHRKNGLPDFAEFINIIRNEAAKAKYDVNIKVLSNLNLKWWYIAQYIETIPVIPYVHRILLPLVKPIFKIMNQEPTYRKIIILNLTSELNRDLGK